MGEGGALFTESGESFKRDPKDTRNVYMIVNDSEQGRAIENEAKFNRVDVRYQDYNKSSIKHRNILDKYTESTGITTDQLLTKGFLTSRHVMGPKYKYTYIHNNKEYTVPKNIIGAINDYRSFEARKNKIETNNPNLADRLTINQPKPESDNTQLNMQEWNKLLSVNKNPYKNPQPIPNPIAGRFERDDYKPSDGLKIYKA